eukprot:TRINITY_DN66686_c0_g1_i1.p1 TRINITY_DN66686_c0_g1~~TRINITY_DN66686_c0_g1_i1.p1  ORF type:complete len:560 (+),score=111.07 TRINITY_DN66686_c0_g1_i1:82-1680(+)
MGARRLPLRARQAVIAALQRALLYRRTLAAAVCLVLAFEFYIRLVVPRVYDKFYTIDPSYRNPFGDHVSGDPARQEPQQVHVSPGGGAGKFLISWVTHGPPRPGRSVVRYGASAGALTHAASAVPTASSSWPACPGVVRGMHVVPIDVTPLALAPGQQVHYTVAAPGAPAEEREFAFTPPPPPGSGVARITAFGDLAGVRYRRHIGNPKALHADKSYRDWVGGAIARQPVLSCIPLLRNWTAAARHDVVVHAGDIAYTLDGDCGRVGDAFMLDIEPIASGVPYLFGPGNLEMEPWGFLGYWHYEARYAAQLALGRASGSGSTRWYSYEVGLMHIAVIDTNPWAVMGVTCNTGRETWRWLDRDLSAVNRTRTPWVAVIGHRPLYCTKDPGPRGECTSEAAVLRDGGQTLLCSLEGLEPLFQQHGVDLYLCGHTHHYERTWPMARGKVVQRDYVNPRGVVHVLSGIAGGQEEWPIDGWHVPTKDFDAFRDEGLHISVSLLTVTNATHLTLEQVSMLGHTRDRFTIVQGSHGGPW